MKRLQPAWTCCSSWFLFVFNTMKPIFHEHSHSARMSNRECMNASFSSVRSGPAWNIARALHEESPILIRSRVDAGKTYTIERCCCEVTVLNCDFTTMVMMIVIVLRHISSYFLLSLPLSAFVSLHESVVHCSNPLNSQFQLSKRIRATTIEKLNKNKFVHTTQ